MNGIESDLELFELNADIGIFSVKIAVLLDLMCETPIVMNEKGTVE